MQEPKPSTSTERCAADIKRCIHAAADHEVAARPPELQSCCLDIIDHLGHHHLDPLVQVRMHCVLATYYLRNLVAAASLTLCAHAAQRCLYAQGCSRGSHDRCYSAVQQEDQQPTERTSTGSYNCSCNSGNDVCTSNAAANAPRPRCAVLYVF
jgi:hypothetical protein